MKRDYENDAWEMLEDYFDRIRVELIKANIKGDERRQVITDLRSHVQMKADEILARHDNVNYADVLEIMGELGSPSEIAGSYGHDMEDVKAKNDDELFTENKKVSLDLTHSITDETKVVPPTILPETSSVTPQKSNIIVELCLLSLRIFQVVIFIQPWFQLAVFSHWILDNAVHSWGNDYDNTLTNFSIPFIFATFMLIMLEQYLVREILISRSYNPALQSKISIHLFRFALLSNLVIFFIVPFNGNGIILAIIGTVILLFNEALTDSPLRKFILDRLKDCYRNITIEDRKYGIIMLCELLIFQVGVYIAVIIYMTIATASVYPYIAYSDLSMWIMVLVSTFVGLFFAIVALSVKLLLNRLFTYSITRIEISTSIWAFRFILASLFSISILVMDPFSVIILVALPILFTEHIFTRIVAATTKYDFVLWQEVSGAYMSIVQLFSLFGSDASKKIEKSPVASPTPVHEPNTAVQNVTEDMSVKKESELKEFLNKIFIIYLKAFVVFLFFVAFYILNNLLMDWDWNDYQDHYYTDTIFFGFFVLMVLLLISTYVLYTKTTSDAKKLDLPWFYMMMMVLSWILLFQVANASSFQSQIISFLILFLSSPFLLIQVSSSYTLLFKGDRRDY